jgi:2-methylcitrate dehydratase PrpD
MDHPTRLLAEWSCSLAAADVPAGTRTRAGWQWASVLGAILAGRDHPRSRAVGAVARRGAHGGAATLVPEGDAVPVEAAVWANAARSVLLDFDDYLFAGHTGHSAVLVTLALGEELGATGEDLLAATVVANEAGGRLGAAMLTGPHNGQMWAYIHNLAGAVAAARLLGLDAAGTAAAIGLSLTQPPYPLPATFMGSDGKALTASGPAVEGLRAALLAAEGYRCDVDVLSDRSGFFARLHPAALAGMLSGFGEAWLTDSLSYKIYPGCAYLDTAVDAILSLSQRHRAERGTALRADDVASVRVEAGILTAGMEAMSGWYRGPGGSLREMNMNFSAAFSVAIALLAGRLTAAELHPDWWSPRAAEIESVASRVEVVLDQAMNELMRDPEPRGFDLASALGVGREQPVLDGASFVGYESRFPATVEVRLRDGSLWREDAVVPRGGAGRPEAETRALVLDKLEGNGAAPGAFAALEAMANLESAGVVAKLVTTG